MKLRHLNSWMSWRSSRWRCKFFRWSVVMAALRSRCRHYILQLWFLSSSFFFPRLIWVVADWMSTWCDPMLHAARWKCRTQKIGKNSLSAQHHTTLLSCILSTKARIDNRKKKLVKQQYVSHMASQYAKLGPTSGWDQLASLGHPSKFQGFLVLASLLQRRRSTEVNQTLLDVWPSAVITFSGAVAHWLNFATCKIHFAPKSCVLLYW